MKITTIEGLAPNRAGIGLPTESMLVTTREALAYRIQKSNSLNRSSLLVAVDEQSFRHLRSISDRDWFGARFRAVTDNPEVLVDLEGNQSQLEEEFENTDVVVLVAQAGEKAEAAPHVGQAGLIRGIMTAGFVEHFEEAPGPAQVTLNAMRKNVVSLFVGFDEDTLADVLSAIRA
jgi:hypothetical protein